jgi:hypothetical protein
VNVLTEVVVKNYIKASGEDSMTSEQCKWTSKEFKLKLFKSVNEVYVTGKITSEWRNALVIPIF